MAGQGTSPVPASTGSGWRCPASTRMRVAANWPHATTFAGGLQAGLLTIGSGGSRLWNARWHVGDRDAADGRIWGVDYRSSPVDLGPQRPDPEQAARILDQALQRAEVFSIRHDLQPWRGLFAGRRWSNAGDSQRTYLRDLFPDGWGRADSRRLADMAAAAWVFGGMGSWNDLGFAEPDRQAEYEQISRQLYAAIMRACVAAANADLRSA